MLKQLKFLPVIIAGLLPICCSDSKFFGLHLQNISIIILDLQMHLRCTGQDEISVCMENVCSVIKSFSVNVTYNKLSKDFLRPKRSTIDIKHLFKYDDYKCHKMTIDKLPQYDNMSYWIHVSVYDCKIE